MILLNLLLAALLTVTDASVPAYDEPVLIPDNLLRQQGQSAFDSSSTSSSSDRALFPWTRRDVTFKLPFIDIAPRQGDLSVQVSGTKLPMNATTTRKARQRLLKPPHAFPEAMHSTTPSTTRKTSQVIVPKRKKRKLPKNAGAVEVMRHNALLQKDQLMDQALVQKYRLLQWQQDAQRQLMDRYSGSSSPHDTKKKRPSTSALVTTQPRRPVATPPPVAIQLSIDPISWLRLMTGTYYFMLSLGQATACTLRFLAPLVVARRGLNYLEEIGMDWYRGRYLRTTVRQVHHEYHNTYQVPAVLRSLGRLSAQIIALFLLGRFMEYVVVGLDQNHCYPLTPTGIIGGIEQCSWLCCIWWMISTMGLGHAGATAMSVWGGPLRVQTASQRPVAKQIFTKPWKLLNWMRDPDRWLRDIASNQRRESLKPFHPNRLLFPATWQPLYFLQLLAVANAMTGETKLRHVLMRYLLLQQAFGDEWFRMLMVEKRVALSIGLVVGYYLSTFIIFTSVASVSSLGTCLILPYLVSVIISGWMNVSIYFERRKRDMREEYSTVSSDPPIGALAW